MVFEDALSGSIESSLLWVNSAPKNSFGPQTISVPGLSKYKSLLIGFSANSVGEKPAYFSFIDLENRTTGGTGVSYVYWGASQGRNVEGIQGRSYSVNAGKETITFEGCWGAERTGTMNNNNNYFSQGYGLLIPAYVWGLKDFPSLKVVK